MSRLYEKSIMVLLCIPALAMSGELYAPVIALLISVSVSAAAQIFNGKPAAWVLLGLCAVMCGVMPVMFCTMPIILCDALAEKKWWLTVPAATVFINIDSLSTWQIIMSFVGIIAAVVIYLRISGLEKKVGKLTELRDDITEKNMQLTSQNLRLAAAQDNEVRLATLKERNRIAREIHDNVGHMLTRSILQTGAIQIINKDETLKEPLDELRATLDGAMTSIRTSVHDLHDNSIDLKKTIEEMCAAVDDRFKVNLNYDAGEDISGEVKLCTAGIVKESISNAVKHSSGDRINIVFREHPAFFQLLVEDNGNCGKLQGRSLSGHGGIGLGNMEDRAAGIGGQITFTPSEDGFRVFMTIPKER